MYNLKLKNNLTIYLSVFLNFLLVLTFASKTLAQEVKPIPADPIATETKKIADNDELADNFNLKKHNSIYFLYGQPDSKLQFSFKYEIVKNIPIFIGYTQLSYWNLKQESKPFTDVNYNPELFYTFKFNNKHIQSLDIAPYEHKSNGKSGTDSRSYERVYVQLNSRYVLSKFTLLTNLRVGHIYGEDENNDIVEYYGPVDLKLSLTHFNNQGLLDKARFDFRIFAGGKYLENVKKGGHELGMSLRLGGADINPSLYVQHYSGYVESLLNYNQYVEEWRVGFIL